MAFLLTRMLAAVSSNLPDSLRWRIGRVVEWISSRPYFTPNAMLKVRRGGCVWRLNPADYICGHLFWQGALDRNDVRLISGHVHKGDCLMDIGSNFGYYSVTLANQLGGDCRVDAFEPFPDTFAKLQGNIALNSLDCIRAHQFAIGDIPGVFHMLPVEGNTGAAYVVGGAGNEQGTAVNVKTLDQFVAEQGIRRLDFVKIDVEGYEYAVLEGGRQTFGTLHPPIMIEVCPENLARQNKSVDELMAKLREYGYRRFHVVSPKGVETFGRNSFDGGWSYRNVFCFSEERNWGSGG